MNSRSLIWSTRITWRLRRACTCSSYRRTLAPSARRKDSSFKSSTLKVKSLCSCTSWRTWFTSRLRMSLWLGLTSHRCAFANSQWLKKAIFHIICKSEANKPKSCFKWLLTTSFCQRRKVRYLASNKWWLRSWAVSRKKSSKSNMRLNSVNKWAKSRKFKVKRSSSMCSKNCSILKRNVTKLYLPRSSRQRATQKKR